MDTDKVLEEVRKIAPEPPLGQEHSLLDNGGRPKRILVWAGDRRLRDRSLDPALYPDMDEKQIAQSIVNSL